MVLVTAISAFQVFDLVYVTTRGGPAAATLVLPMHMMDHAFKFHNVGYGASIAVALAIIILILSILFLKVRGVFKEAV